MRDSARISARNDTVNVRMDMRDVGLLLLVYSLIVAMPLVVVGCSQAVPLSTQDEGWSRVANGLQGRLILVDKGREHGNTRLVPYLELRNVRDLAAPMTVDLSRRRLRIELVGENGAPLGLRRSPPQSGPQVRLSTVVLPRDSFIRMNLQVGTWGIPKDAMLIDTLDEGFVIFEHEKGKVFLRATVTDRKSVV